MSIFDVWNSELSFLLYFKQKKAKLNSYDFPFYISLIEFLILQLAVPDYIQQNKSHSETQDTLLNGKKFHMANISDFCRFQVNHNIQPEKSKSQNVKSGWEAKSQGFCNFLATRLQKDQLKTAVLDWQYAKSYDLTPCMPL